jgi:hypothetical protein
MNARENAKRNRIKKLTDLGRLVKNQPERKSHAGELPVRIVLRCPGPGLAVLLLEARHQGRRHVVVHADLQHLIAAHEQAHLPRRRVLQNLDAGLRDPDWIRIQSGPLIRIQEGKNDPQKLKKFKKFQVLKCWMFSFES